MIDCTINSDLSNFNYLRKKIKMKKILLALCLGVFLTNVNAQVVAPYGGGVVSENAAMNKIDIKEIGRSIHVATVEEGRVVVRRFYRGVWEEFDKTPIEGIFKLKDIKLFAYKAVPYLFCFYDGKMSVIRAIADKWEFVGAPTFGEGVVENPEFSVIGEKPFVIYEDSDYDMIRMISLLENKWYDVDLVPNKGVLSYKLAANYRGDLYLALLNDAGLNFKKVDQMVASMNDWELLTKPVKIDGLTKIDDFEFIENKAYLTYSTATGPVIMSLEDLSKKWETVEKAEEPAVILGKTDYNLNISEYYFITSLSASGMPQYVKNNKTGVWGLVKDLSEKKARGIASTEYKNVIYVAYVDDATSKVFVKTIEKGEEEKEEVAPTGDEKKGEEKKETEKKK